MKYSLISVNDELFESVVYETLDWDEIIIKVDSCMDLLSDIFGWIYSY